MRSIGLNVIFFIIIIFASSCIRILPHQVNEADYCKNNFLNTYDSTYVPAVLDDYLIKDSALLDHFSYRDLVVANGLGILEAIKKLNHGQTKASNSEEKLKLIALRQDILFRVLVARTNISSIVAELDCEGERADQLASYIDDKYQGRLLKLTVVSIVLGASADVVTTLLNGGKGYSVVGLGGAVGSALFAFAAFVPERKVYYYHQRNLLADIWYNPDQSRYFPTSIWYIIRNQASGPYDDPKSLTESLKATWKTYENVSKANKEQLYFGAGGKYSANDLHTRANMVNQLQAAIRLLDLDIQSLIQKVYLFSSTEE